MHEYILTARHHVNCIINTWVCAGLLACDTASALCAIIRGSYTFAVWLYRNQFWSIQTILLGSFFPKFTSGNNTWKSQKLQLKAIKPSFRC